MLWAVTYYLRGANHVLQVEADTISGARIEALPLVGTRGKIIRIERDYPEVPATDPSKRKVQGT